MHSSPPKKKRRLAMPEFESSFDVGAPRDQPSQDLKSLRKTSQLFDKLHALHAFENDHAADERGFGNIKRVKTPGKTPRTAKSHSMFPSFEISSSPSVGRIKTGTHSPSMSAAFADFSSNFGLERKNRPPDPAISSARDPFGDATTIPARLEPRIQKPTNVTKTPLRVFEPPPFSDMRQGTLSSPWNRTRNLVTPTTPKINVHDTRKVTSVTSHLSSLKPINAPSEALRDTPKKGISSFSPNVRLGKPTPAFTPSKISHIERAERIAQSAHDDFKAKTAEMPILDFVRGMDISPQKDHGERRKFIRGGLAERVQHLILKSSTNLTLWQTEHGKDAGCSKPPKGNLHLRITSILSYTYHPTGIYRRQQPSTVNPRTVLATCHILDDNLESNEPKLVVFLIPSNKPNGDIHIGKEVYVWRPWHEIQIPKTDEGSIHTEGSESMTTDTALLCSRFIVLS